MFEERLKQIKLATSNDLNAVQQNAARNKEKLEKLQTFELSYFHGKKYFGDDGFQSRLVYRPKFSKMLLLGNQGDYLKLNFIHYIMLSCLKM